MEHAYIEEHGVAERFICNTLNEKERADFEQHLVDCQECMDRILLAGMFHSRVVNQLHNQPPPLRSGLVLRLRPRQLVWLFAASALLLSAILLLLWLFERYSAR